MSKKVSTKKAVKETTGIKLKAVNKKTAKTEGLMNRIKKRNVSEIKVHLGYKKSDNGKGNTYKNEKDKKELLETFYKYGTTVMNYRRDKVKTSVQLGRLGKPFQNKIMKLDSKIKPTDRVAIELSLDKKLAPEMK